MSNEGNGLHEDSRELSNGTKDRHRAIASLMEELEAVDWYGQRVEATEDDELRAILDHNRAEEIEHAAMLIEWLRRHDPKFDEELRERIFRDGPIVREEGAGDESTATATDLGVGSLKPETPTETESAAQ